MSSKTPRASGHAEAVALFRYGVIGSLVGRDFEHGELAAELRALADKRWRPPGSDVTRCFGVSTLERWYYAYRRDGLDGLYPKRRSDRGRARALAPSQRALLLDIRREHPRASAPLILRTLIAEGVLEPGQISAATLNRLYARASLPRQRRKATGGGPRRRLRWQAPCPGALWQGDVCHGPMLTDNGRKQPVRIHALLDDHSRYVVALEVHGREREVEMLGLLGRALVRHGRPDGLYVDNGSTYVGEGLSTVCGRLGFGLSHPEPYDPQARGKIERFWRTMREQCLDYVSPEASMHDLTVRLHAWLDQHYHRSPHAGLLGKTPQAVWEGTDSAMRPIEHEALRDAYVVTESRRVRPDNTLDVDGITHELDVGFLAGKNVTLARCLPPFDAEYGPVVLEGERAFVLSVVNPTKNAHAKRTPLPAWQSSSEPTGFDPATTQLDRAAGRLPNPEDV